MFVILKLLLSYEIMHVQGKKITLIFIWKEKWLIINICIRFMNLKILLMTWN